MIAPIEKLTTEQKRQICLVEIERNRREFTGLAYTVLGDWHYAEDVVQIAFVNAIEGIEGFRGDLTFVAWVSKIVVNAAHDSYRRRNVKGRRDVKIYTIDSPDYKGMDEPPDNRTPHLAALISYNSLIGLVHRELDNITPVYRGAFVLNVFEGMNFREIGEILGLKQDTVYARAQRAKLQLAGRLGQQGYTP